MEGETDDDEEDGEDDEAAELDGFTADSVDCGDGDPVAGDGACTDDNEITNGSVAEDVVDVGATGVADCSEDGGVVETETIEGDVEEEP